MIDLEHPLIPQEQGATIEAEPAIEFLTLEQRRLIWMVDHFKNHYGELLPDHPAQQLANRCLEQVQTAFNLSREERGRVIILPEMPSINAMVLPDGTILCSLKLLEEAESEEAVQGVFGHELQHVASNDTKHIQNIMNQSKPDLQSALVGLVKELGLKRFAEYRSDMEGAVMKLDQAGINPFGYKLFLEKLSHQERSRKYQPDTVHGRLVDRALNLGLLTRYYNLPSLTHDLHAIPDSEVAAWRSNLPLAQTVTTFFRTTDLRDANARKMILNQELTAIKQMPFTRLNSVMQELFGHWMHTTIAPTTAERVAKLLKTSAAVIDEALKQKYPEGNDRWLARLAHFSLVTGVDIAVPNAQLEHQPYEETVKSLRQPAQLLKTTQDFARLRQVIDTMSMNALPYAVGDANVLMKVVARIGPQQAELFDSYDVWFDEMLKLTASLMQFSEKKSVVQVTEYQLMSTAIEVVKKQLQRKETPEAADAFATIMQAKLIGLNSIPPEALTSAVVENKQSRLFVSELNIVLDTPEKQKARKNAETVFRKQLQAVFGTLDVDQVSDQSWLKNDHKIISIITSEIAQLDLFAMLYVMRAWRDQLYTVMDYFQDDLGSSGDRMIRYVVSGLQQLMAKDKNFSNLPEIFRRIILEHFAIHDEVSSFNKSMVGWESREGYGTSLVASAKDRDKFFERAGTGICALPEKKFIQFVQLYEFYTNTGDGILISEKKNTSSFLKEAFRDPTGKNVDLPAIYLVQELAKLEPVEIFDRIHYYERLGIQAKQLLYFSAVRYGAPVVEKITENIEIVLQSNYADEAIDFLEKTLDDVLLIEQFKKYVQYKRYQEADTFNKKFDVCFNNSKTRFDLALKDRFIETEMRSRSDYEQVQKAFRNQVAEISNQGSAELGSMALVDSTNLFTENAHVALQKLLQTRRSDREIKDYMASVFNHHSVVLLEDQSQWAQEAGRRKLQGFVASLDRLLHSLYVIPETARFALVKRLLVDSGMIHDTKQRQSALRMLFSEVVTSSRSDHDQALHKALGQIMEAIGKIDDWELMFYLVAPVLAEHIARPPVQSVPWHDVYEFENKYSHLKKFNLVNVLKLEDLHKSEKYPWRRNLEYSAIAAEHLRGFLTKQELFESKKTVKQLSPVEFIVDAAPRTGALIVRILQMLPQFMEIRTDEAEVLNQLYDKMRGQSKLAAIATVERGWPEMWNVIAEFGDRIGGGSLMTVYRIKTQDRESKVIRVVNPNIAFHLEASRKFVLNTIEELRKNNAINESLYQQLRLAVDMVSVWIKEELNFEHFLERDQQFREHNNQFTYQDCKYSMLVPKSEGPVSNVFQIEQEVKGRNLTDWDALVAEGHNMRKIVALIVKSYRQQIGTGLAHGDVHIGNYAVTPNNKVAIFDRTYFIKLSESEQRIMQFALDGQVDFATVGEYLQTLLPADGNVDLATVISQVTALGEAVMAKNFVAANHSIMMLRQEGVNVPLHISLLLRNVQALTKLAEKANFANLQEALEYS